MVAEQEGSLVGGGVSSPASPAGDVNPNPNTAPLEGSGPAPVPGSEPVAAQAKPNLIPQDRAEEMARRREQRAAERVRAEMARQFETIQHELRSTREGMKTDIATAFLKSLGYEPEQKPPEYVDRTQVEQMLQGHQQEIQKAIQVRAEYESANADLERARTKYAEFFEADPDLEDRLVKLWGADKAPMSKIIQGEIKRLQQFYDKRQAKYVAAKRQDGAVAPVAPGGGQQNTGGKAHDLRTPQGLDAAVDEWFAKARL